MLAHKLSLSKVNKKGNINHISKLHHYETRYKPWQQKNTKTTNTWGGKQHASKQPMNHRGSKNKNIENT